jgi:hypothetical protein
MFFYKIKRPDGSGVPTGESADGNQSVVALLRGAAGPSIFLLTLPWLNPLTYGPTHAAVQSLKFPFKTPKPWSRLPQYPRTVRLLGALIPGHSCIALAYGHCLAESIESAG